MRKISGFGKNELNEKYQILVRETVKFRFSLWPTEDWRLCLLSDVVLCFNAQWVTVEMNRIRERRGETEMLCRPKCLFLLNAFQLLLQATTATHILMGAYENIVRFSNKISTFSWRCTNKKMLSSSENVTFNWIHGEKDESESDCWEQDEFVCFH